MKFYHILLLTPLPILCLVIHMDKFNVDNVYLIKSDVPQLLISDTK